ncbi:MAG: amino acid adenylation domain-containing protein [Prevotella sp.]|nr:amino acid adenylation domain-containing protein [Prevotella sp.]
MPHSIPLTEEQNGIMLDWVQHPDLTQYNVCCLHSCPPSVDAEKLYQCLIRMVERHDIFYTRIAHDDEGFCQYIDRSQQLELDYVEMDEADFDAYKHNYIRPINVFRDALVHMAIVKTQEHVHFIIDASHLIIDGVSCSLIWNELTKEYLQQQDDNSSAIQPTPLGIYVAKEQEQLHSPAYQQAEAFYKKAFEGYTMTRIPSPHPEAIGEFICAVTKMQKTEVEAFCKSYGLSPNILFMAASAIAFSAFSGEQRVAFYSVNHGRSDRQIREAIGMFVKTMPFKADLTNGDQPILDFVRDFKHQMMSNIRYGVYPFNHFCRELKIQPENSFNFHVTAKNATIGDLPVDAEQYYSGPVADSMTAGVWDKGDNYEIEIVYNDQRYDHWLMQQLANTIRSITENIMCHPDATLATLPLVTEDEARDILEVSTGDSLPSPADYELDFVSMFCHQAQLSPTAIALVDHVGSLTYEELDRQSSLLAHHLISEKGVTAGDRVVIKMSRCKEFMVAVIAVMKAGACYVPVDPNLPAERIQYIVNDSCARLIVNDEWITSQTSNLKPQTSNLKPQTSNLKSQTSNLAYIIYTSGSTGLPKGVVISHRALASFVRTCRHTYQLTSADRILCHASFSFDASVEDLFPILTCGGELHILDEAIRTDLPAIKTYIEEHHITGGNYTTAFGELLLMSYPDLPLRYVTLGGERLDRMPQGLTCRFFNSYGPTEFTVDATFWEAPQQTSNLHSSTPPIGRPVCDCQALVLDERGRILPLGCPGELCLSGPQIADGYWQRPELTAERFVDGKFRTGDFVRWQSIPANLNPQTSLQLEYIGRHDRLVKLYGFRIELGEIEAAIMAQPHIVQAIVLVRVVNGNTRLCAWFTANQPVDTTQLKASLSQSMPHYMIPAIYQQIDTIPLTTNGKIDEQKLPTEHLTLHSPSLLTHNSSLLTHNSPLESLLHDIVCETLGLESVSVEADLFSDLALSSLQAASVAFKAMKQGLDINVSTLYRARTIRQVVAASSSSQENIGDTALPLMLLICGYPHQHPHFDAFIEIFSKRFSIFVIDSFIEAFRGGKPVSYERLMEQYVDIVNRELRNRTISVIVGWCFGGELALLLAQRIKEQFNSPRVLVLDGIYRHSDFVEVVPESAKNDETLVDYIRISNALALQLPEPLYDGDALFCYAGIIPPYRSSDFPDLLLTPAEEEELRRLSRENETLWRQHYPNAGFYQLSRHHYEFLSRENLLDVAQILKNHWNL